MSAPVLYALYIEDDTHDVLKNLEVGITDQILIRVRRTKSITSARKKTLKVRKIFGFEML